MYSPSWQSFSAIREVGTKHLTTIPIKNEAVLNRQELKKPFDLLIMVHVWKLEGSFHVTCWATLSALGSPLEMYELCVYTCRCAMQVWRSEGSFRELVLFFYHVVLQAWRQSLLSFFKNYCNSIKFISDILLTCIFWAWENTDFTWSQTIYFNI